MLVNNNTSELKTITFGIPHGLVLEPLLFIVYIDDISRASNTMFSI